MFLHVLYTTTSFWIEYFFSAENALTLAEWLPAIMSPAPSPISIRFSMFFFSIRVSFTQTDDSQDSRAREGTIFYSTLPFPPAYEHSNIYLQLCMWDDHHVFLIAMLVFTQAVYTDCYSTRFTTLSNYFLGQLLSIKCDFWVGLAWLWSGLNKKRCGLF